MTAYQDFLKDNFKKYKDKPVYSLCKKHGDKFHQAGYVLWPNVQKSTSMILLVHPESIGAEDGDLSSIGEKLIELDTSHKSHFPQAKDFTVANDRLNIIVVISAQRTNGELEAIYEKNIKPIAIKKEFTQLFKQPTKRKEFCL